MQKVKTIPFTKYGMSTMEVTVYQDDYWLFGEVNGDLNSYNSEEEALEAFESVKDEESMMKEMGWTDDDN